jgi:2-dehydro-3-deoxygalactonokinase
MVLDVTEPPNYRTDLEKTALIAVDWGTSSLRAARLDAHGQVLEEQSSPRGILTIPPGEFASFFIAAYAFWISVPGIFCLISGMAGSKQGWVEAPYCPCPAGFDEVAAQLKWLDAKTAPCPIAIVPGLSCEHAHAPDVMRGEEVQIFGAMQLTGLRDGLFVLPGTHSKWAQVKDGRVVGFRTYMTGEIYALLSQQSILSKTITADAPFDEAAFADGVLLSAQGKYGSLLHTAFSARTLSLFNARSAGALASYLSGLVIGEELRVQSLHSGTDVVLMGSAALTLRYTKALALLGVRTRALGSEASWAGLHALSKSVGTVFNTSQRAKP